jgi:hypothetical protein
MVSVKCVQSKFFKRDRFERYFDVSGTFSVAFLTLSPYKLL